MSKSQLRRTDLLHECVINYFFNIIIDESKKTGEHLRHGTIVLLCNEIHEVYDM